MRAGPADGAEEPCLSRTLRCQVLQAKELVVITSGLESDFRAQVENALRIIGCANSLILKRVLKTPMRDIRHARPGGFGGWKMSGCQSASSFNY